MSRSTDVRCSCFLCTYRSPHRDVRDAELLEAALDDADRYIRGPNPDDFCQCATTCEECDPALRPPTDSSGQPVKSWAQLRDLFSEKP